MIRIRVIEASKLLLGFSIVLLVIALIAVAFGLSRADGDRDVVPTGIVRANVDEEAAAAFAAASSVRKPTVVFEESTYLNGDGLLIEVLPVATASPAPEKTARVLIYHTHTHEAYAPTPENPYPETEKWRTEDTNHSVVRVGAELAEHLRALGVETVHDTTDHEPPKLGTAYERSLQTLQKYADTPFDLYIDLHRDAYSEEIQDVRAVSVGGVSVAQVMILVGDGEGFSPKPDTQANLDFARSLTDRMNEAAPGSCREVLLKPGRYNQHVASPAILVEAGHNLNTLPEALRAMESLARAISQVLDHS